MTFSKFREHTTPLFKKLGILKLAELIILHNALIMFEFHANNLPSAFDNFFTLAKNLHCHNTRFASKQSFCLPRVRTNYGKFSLRYQGPLTWNDIDTSIKTKSKKKF